MVGGAGGIDTDDYGVVSGASVNDEFDIVGDVGGWLVRDGLAWCGAGLGLSGFIRGVLCLKNVRGSWCLSWVMWAQDSELGAGEWVRGRARGRLRLS